jgi:lipopolysaccharide export system protein LptA
MKVDLSMKRLTLAVPALLALALAAGPAAAQLATGSSAPVDITADEGEVINSQCLSIWRGDAEALQADTRLRAQVIRVFSSPKAGVAANSQGRCGATQRLEADGEVYYVTPSQAVRGDRAVYVAETDTITITGNVVVTQGRSVARGDRMTVKVKTGQVNLESTVKGRGKPGRVRGVFYPSETSDGDAAPASR